jgi:hypothetical protein
LSASGLVDPCAHTTFCLAVDTSDDRRRAALLLARPGARAHAVVKLDRSVSEEDRARAEQRTLARLPESATTPQPLGSGRAGPVRWSAESVVTGAPLLQVLANPRTRVHDLLGRLAEWLGDIALATAHPVDWLANGAREDVLPLRGPARDLLPLLARLDGVPAVLVHGDLGAGLNVVVDETGRPGVLDWETACVDGLPLLDLLPLLCAGLARARGRLSPHEHAAHAIDLARGRHPDSAWFLGQIAGHLDRVGVPERSVGAVALLAWGHQASRRLRRDELLRAAGVQPVLWTSVSELVLPRWLEEIGPDWPQVRDTAVSAPPAGAHPQRGPMRHA